MPPDEIKLVKEMTEEERSELHALNANPARTPEENIRRHVLVEKWNRETNRNLERLRAAKPPTSRQEGRPPRKRRG